MALDKWGKYGEKKKAKMKNKKKNDATADALRCWRKQSCTSRGLNLLHVKQSEVWPQARLYVTTFCNLHIIIVVMPQWSKP